MLMDRFRRWIEHRLPRSDSWTLAQHNLYILPTRGGWGFGLTLLVMLVAAVNYQLNLGYALTFLLGGAALVSLHQTHANLRRMTLRLRAPAAVFAGEPVTLEVLLDNPARRDRPAIGLGLYSARREGMAFVDVPAQGSTLARLRFTPTRRGRHAVPTLLVETHFPLGLFRAWTVWRPAAEVLVYPAPEQPAPPLPAAQPGGGHEPPRRAGQGSEFDGVRAWRRGDALRQIVWKKVARSGGLVSREMGGSAAQALVLDWRDAAPAAGAPAPAGVAEARLSRLAAWVLAAEERGQPYALALPGQAPQACALGELQRRGALERLALWGEANPVGAAPSEARPPSGPTAARRTTRAKPEEAGP